MQRLFLSFLLAGGLGAPAFAQAPQAPAGGSPAAAPSVPDGAASENVASEGRLRHALDLPFAARELRLRGVPELDVRASFGAMRDAKVPADEAVEIAEAAAADVGEHGPVDNFGAFVQAQLASGLRGKDLSAAIKAEHVAHGKGKPAGTEVGNAAGHPGGQGHEKHDGAEHGGGKHEGADRAPGREGKAEPADMHRERGERPDGKAASRPESSGKPADGGKGSDKDKSEKGGDK
ncbi:MAG: hypothetical protein Q8P18_16980 [Pseudomonadota bacterium]|nr:hypothetical protein [Pseudomonadota bacterium]